MCKRLMQRKDEGKPEAARPQTARASSSNFGDRLHEVVVLVCPPVFLVKVVVTLFSDAEKASCGSCVKL